MIETIGFGLAALIALWSAIQVARNPNLVHAVLWLGLTLVTTAGLYAMLDASFLAGVQVMVYVGGVITLLIFGAMITRKHEGISVPAESGRQGRAAMIAIGFFAVMAGAILKTPYLDAPPPAPLAPVTSTLLGQALLREHLLAFEAVSFLLLGAIIGAIVIARRRDPGEASIGFTAPAPAKPEKPAAVETDSATREAA